MVVYHMRSHAGIDNGDGGAMRARGLGGWRLAAAVVALAVFGVAGAVSAQEDGFREDRTVFGGLLNQDYYTAPMYTEPALLLRLVEFGHFSQQMFDNFRAGRYREVIGDLNYTLERIANHPGALSLMGTVATITKVPNLAIPYYENALALYPQYAETHALYGYYLAEIGDLDKSVTHLKDAIERDAKLPSAHAWLAMTYAKQKRFDLARQAADEAKKLGYPKPIDLQDGSKPISHTPSEHKPTASAPEKRKDKHSPANR
jgi:tetratricopeptide (TPR) repeat protein